jgi:hypothetical protein
LISIDIFASKNVEHVINMAAPEGSATLSGSVDDHRVEDTTVGVE